MKSRNMSIGLRMATCILAVALFVMGCENSSPTGPGTLKDYPVYFNSGNHYRPFLRYHPTTGRIDSITVPLSPNRAMAVSADGSRLYLGSATQTVVLEVDSMTPLASIPYGPWGLGLTESPDGKLLAIASRDGLYIYSTGGYSLEFSHPDTSAAAVFSSDGQTLYAVRGQGDGGLLRVQIERGSYVVDTLPFSVGRVMPDPDGRTLYLATFGLFMHYDLHRDTALYLDTLSGGIPDIEVTPDGRYVFYSDPGSRFRQTNALCVYEPRTRRLRTKISCEAEFDGYQVSMNAGSIAITPDGRTLVATWTSGGWTLPGFFVVDVHSLEVKEYFDTRPMAMGQALCQQWR